ncbi:MAG: hypothetical protein ACTSO7_15595 [Candidatus Heimdallarchaeota archaeon]
MSQSRRRATAIKLRVSDIINGEFTTQQDGSKVLHVKTDDLVRRVRILGEVTDKVDIESDETIILDVNDKTGVIKVKGGGSEWSSNIYADMKDLKEGMEVDVAGLVKESSDGAPYIQCELCIPIAKLSESDEIKDQILVLLKDPERKDEGCTFDEIKRTLGLSTRDLEPELRALQSDGDIFEPIPGTFKYV